MACRAETPAFDEACPLFPFRGKAGALIAAYKLGKRPSLAPFFADLLEPLIRQRWPDHAIVPVPPRPGVRRERGWDQVELVARSLGRRGFDVVPCLERGASLEQKTLGLEERRRNACKAYRLGTRIAAPCRALLLDDVFTSGATASACARALKQGGAAHVVFVALAAD